MKLVEKPLSVCGISEMDAWSFIIENLDQASFDKAMRLIHDTQFVQMHQFDIRQEIRETQ